jgi:hypothetical protein
MTIEQQPEDSAEPMRDTGTDGGDPRAVSGRWVLLGGFAILAAVIGLWTTVGPIRPPPPKPPPSVVAETMLIMEAQEALDAGTPEQALDAIDRHAERYPEGVLAARREAERIAALCALGRGDEARAARNSFLERHPDAGEAERVRAACQQP